MYTIVYHGEKFNVLKKPIMLPSGKKVAKEIVEYPGAAAILPLISENTVLLLKQYRVALDNWIIEIPAGTLKPNETPLECAMRELEEETGFKAKEWVKMLEIYTSPGYSNEILHVFLAKGLERGVKKLEESEILENIYLTLDEALNMVKRSEIKDAKTIIALLYYTHYFRHAYTVEGSEMC